MQVGGSGYTEIWSDARTETADRAYRILGTQHVAIAQLVGRRNCGKTDRVFARPPGERIASRPPTLAGVVRQAKHQRACRRRTDGRDTYVGLTPIPQP